RPECRAPDAISTFRHHYESPTPRRSSSLGRESEYDVELGIQFANLRTFERSEVDRYRVARLGIAHRTPNTVALVLRFALDVALRGELLALGHFHREVDVRRTAGVGHRLDRAEVILTARAGQESAET